MLFVLRTHPVNVHKSTIDTDTISTESSVLSIKDYNEAPLCTAGLWRERHWPQQIFYQCFFYGFLLSPNLIKSNFGHGYEQRTPQGRALWLSQKTAAENNSITRNGTRNQISTHLMIMMRYDGCVQHLHNCQSSLMKHHWCNAAWICEAEKVRRLNQAREM